MLTACATTTLSRQYDTEPIVPGTASRMVVGASVLSTAAPTPVMEQGLVSLMLTGAGAGAGVGAGASLPPPQAAALRMSVSAAASLKLFCRVLDSTVLSPSVVVDRFVRSQSCRPT